MTKTRSILIWGNEDILSSSIELFLDANENWNVINLSNKEGADELMRAIEINQPEIIIIHQECPNNGNNLPLQILKAHPSIKVITVNLENNAMEVYTKKELIVKQATDLIAVIEHEP